jgi:hypothetical protein
MKTLRTLAAAGALLAATGCSEEATQEERDSFALAGLAISTYQTRGEKCVSALSLAEHHRGNDELDRRGKRELLTDIVDDFCGWTGEQCKAALESLKKGDTSGKSFDAIAANCAPPVAVE